MLSYLTMKKMEMKNAESVNSPKAKACLLLIVFFASAGFVPDGKLAMGQLSIDNILIPPTLPQADWDTYRIQSAIDVAHAATLRSGLSSRVIIPAGKIENGQYVTQQYRLNKTIVVKGGVVLSTDSGGRRGVRLKWENVKDDQALLRFSDCHGGGLENIVLSVRSLAPGQRGNRVTGILLESQSSALLESFTVNLSQAGEDAIGLHVAKNSSAIRNTESLTVRDFDITAPKPVVIESGDNMTFSTFDLTLIERHSTDSTSAIFQNRNGYTPANLVIGPGTGQKGDHAICFTGQRERLRGTGDCFTIQNFRWEQGTPKGPAWKIDINRFDPRQPRKRLHAIESVAFINCRHSPQKSNPSYIGRDIPTNGVLNTNFVGGYYPGKFKQ